LELGLWIFGGLSWRKATAIAAGLQRLNRENHDKQAWHRLLKLRPADLGGSINA
jgi:hypothetical protein